MANIWFPPLAVTGRHKHFQLDSFQCFDSCTRLCNHHGIYQPRVNGTIFGIALVSFSMSLVNNFSCHRLPARKLVKQYSWPWLKGRDSIWAGMGKEEWGNCELKSNIKAPNDCKLKLRLPVYFLWFRCCVFDIRTQTEKKSNYEHTQKAGPTRHNYARICYAIGYPVTISLKKSVRIKLNRKKTNI